MSSSKDVPDTTGLITSEAILYKLAMKKNEKNEKWFIAYSSSMLDCT